MHMQNRLLRIVHSPTTQSLIGSDVRGRVHQFDYDLNLIQSSPVVSYDRPINAICLTDKYILTKDRFGAIGKWSLQTLEPLDFLDGQLVCDRHALDEDARVSPTPNRGISVFNNRIYTNNAYGQWVVLDVESFNIVEIGRSPSKIFIDCICAQHPETHALTDVVGNLYIGNLEANEFPIKRKIDTNVVHGIVYDQRHDRFWTTQDGGLGEDKCVRTGVTTIDKDGSNFQEFKLSHEDNEFIAITPDQMHVFAGGFNGKIAIFDNTERDFKLEAEVGPLEFQIIAAAVVSRDQYYALLQTGDIIRLNRAGEEVCRAANRNRCVWTLEPHPGDDSIVYAGTDHGVSILQYGPGLYDSVNIRQLAKHVHGFGICKDVKPFADGSYISISRSGYVFRADENGKVLWSRELPGVPRGIALDACTCHAMVSTDAKSVWELDTATGEIRHELRLGGASYACIYADDGRRVVTCDNGTQVLVFAPKADELLGRIGFNSRLKRLFRGSNGGIFVTGPDGMFELDLEHYCRKKSFGEYLVSTKESGVLCAGHVYAGGYGYQVATYRYEDEEIIDLEETAPDFTKAFAARIPEDNVPILLVGGRGGFINTYRIYQGLPFKNREFYIR